MSTIGAIGRCCRSCGKERGPGRRCRRRQQPCLSSCSSCCYPDLASPAASVSPFAAFWPLGPAAVDRAGLQSGRRTPGCTLIGRLACGLFTAAAKAPAPARLRVQRYCDRCARASQEGGGVPFCAASRSPLGIPQPPPFKRSGRWTPGRGGGGGLFLFEILGILIASEILILVQPKCPPVCSAGKRDGLFPCGRICPASKRWSLLGLTEAIFPPQPGELFTPLEVQQKGIEDTRP